MRNKLICFSMDDKEALTLLIKILDKGTLSSEEKNAIKHAIGILSWTSLRAGAMKNLKEKRLLKKKTALKN